MPKEDCKTEKNIDSIDENVLKKYDILKKVGKGAYGVVFKGRCKKNRNIVAVKKIFGAFQNCTDAQRTFREIIFLYELNGHDNIIKLMDVIKAKNDYDIYLIFDFMETDLHEVIKADLLEDIHKKYIIYQLLRALKYIHSGGLLHRDIKPSNILVNSECHIKVADFGLARTISTHINENKIHVLTDYVATRWYRAPEILLGSTNYSQGVDMWSLGCIMGELLSGKPLFTGNSTMNQLEKIIQVIGKPDKKDIEDIRSSFAETIISSFVDLKKKNLKDICYKASNESLDLLQQLLQFNPSKRISAENALKHKYVEEFHSIIDEPICRHIITVPINDNAKYKVNFYRDIVYFIIMRKKKIYSNALKQAEKYKKHEKKDECYKREKHKKKKATVQNNKVHMKDKEYNHQMICSQGNPHEDIKDDQKKYKIYEETHVDTTKQMDCLNIDHVFHNSSDISYDDKREKTKLESVYKEIKKKKKDRMKNVHCKDEKREVFYEDRKKESLTNFTTTTTVSKSDDEEMEMSQMEIRGPIKEQIKGQMEGQIKEHMVGQIKEHMVGHIKEQMEEQIKVIQNNISKISIDSNTISSTISGTEPNSRHNFNNKKIVESFNTKERKNNDTLFHANKKFIFSKEKNKIKNYNLEKKNSKYKASSGFKKKSYEKEKNTHHYFETKCSRTPSGKNYNHSMEDGSNKKYEDGSSKKYEDGSSKKCEDGSSKKYEDGSSKKYEDGSSKKYEDGSSKKYTSSSNKKYIHNNNHFNNNHCHYSRRGSLKSLNKEEDSCPQRTCKNTEKLHLPTVINKSTRPLNTLSRNYYNKDEEKKYMSNSKLKKEVKKKIWRHLIDNENKKSQDMIDYDYNHIVNKTEKIHSKINFKYDEKKKTEEKSVSNTERKRYHDTNTI
ncbi:mitogen-activated protein kinase 1 [Plasmodium sp. gorilla clade G2]|uniref:mitogen-activated protein kinase 1 n=1 Tax=Plasmodium sp. gorilla clade G2 TaxID=880535 RepID=UPI000D216B0B|nr:mitogen-activated protein kinase 1 [Plasmodium sp. gorilla clade G2]SOV19115.1 mitogen-activated protein kinase 1 [Plasmodium sp. gorilla clade G2]